MPQPLPADAHVDHYLTNLSVAFVQDSSQFVASKVFPIVPVQKQSDKYMVYPKGYFLRDEMRARPLGDKAVRAGYDIDSGTYLCEEDALSHAIDDRLRANADAPLDPDKAGQQYLSTQAMIHLDRTWASAYFKSGVWATDLSGASSSPSAGEFLQFDQSASTPIQTIRQQSSAIAGGTGRRPNKLVLGSDVFDTLSEHADIIDRIKYTQRGVLTEQLLAELFGVSEVIVAQGVQNTAKEGQADSIDWIVDAKSMLLVHAAQTPALNTPSAGYTFAWTGLIPGVANATGGVIARYRDDEAHSDILEIRTAYDQGVVASDLGVFFEGAVA